MTRSAPIRDLVPTLLPELFGVNSPVDDYSAGRSLLQQQPRKWLLSGNSRHFVIVGDKEITLFDRQGNFEVRDASTYDVIDDGRPDMPALLKVMRDLGRFKGINGSHPPLPENLHRLSPMHRAWRSPLK